MKRRDFLKGGIRIVAGSMLSPTFGNKAYAAANPKARKLIVVFNQGGNDGMNMLVPYGDSHYSSNRPTLGIKAPDVNDSESAIHLGVNGEYNGIDYFGLHSSMGSLKSVWDDGNLAFIPATHCGPNPNRSHFFQFSFLGQGKYTTNAGVSDGLGWISRYMNDKYPLGPEGLQTFDFASGYFNVFNGWETLGMRDPSSVNYGIDNDKAKQYIASVQSTSEGSKPFASQIAALQSYTLGKISGIENYDFSAPAQNNASYPTSRFGKQMSQVATMLRNTPELEIVYVNKGGWDTHSNQAKRHKDLLADLSQSLKAFNTDMGSDMQDITVLVLSEFGRTAHENKSKDDAGNLTPGTDHGHSFCAVVMGASIQGGIHGGWPGLDPQTELVEGRYLAQKVDYRDVISECLSQLEGGRAESAFQGYNRTPVGFV